MIQISNAQEGIVNKGLAVDFVLPDTWHMQQTDGYSYCEFEKENRAPGSMPPSLVYVYDPKDECSWGTWGEEGSFPYESPANNNAADNDNSAFSNASFAGDTQVNIYDLSGVEVYNGRVNPAKFTLEATTLTGGVYVVKTALPDGTVETKKVTLSR